MAYIQGSARNQVILFPECIDDYVGKSNPVLFIDAFVDGLDLSLLGFGHTVTAEVGRPPYDPRDLLKLYIWGYLNRVRSSRRLETESHRNVEVMWLLKKLTPDFKTIADFRKDNKEAIKKVCREFIFLCKGMDLFGAELVSVDGSKFRAVNSKKRNFNEEKLQRRIKEIEKQIDTYLQELEDNDSREPAPPKINAAELKAKIDKLGERKTEYENLLKTLLGSGESQISLTDPDSRAMKDNQKVEVCYNVQTTVDSKNKLIVDFEVTNDTNDLGQLAAMAVRAKEILGVEELEVLADKGYYSAVQIKDCVDAHVIPYIPEPQTGVPGKDDPHHLFNKNDDFRYDAQNDLYLCPEERALTFQGKKESHDKIMRVYQCGGCAQCPSRSRCTTSRNGREIYRWEYEEVLEDMRRRVLANPDKVKKRQQLSEHPFGTIKRSFNQGYMLMKGRAKVTAEISLTVLAYNVTRVLNILGVPRLIALLRQGQVGPVGVPQPADGPDKPSAVVPSLQAVQFLASVVMAARYPAGLVMPPTINVY